MLITRTSILSGKESTMDLPITVEQIAKWQSGELIQDVFPDLPKEQREFLLSGITPEEWEKAFPPEDDDE